MKKMLFAIPLCVGILSMASCNKNFSRDDYSLVQKGDECVLTVDAFSDVKVKSTGTSTEISASENSINSLQVFVFRGDFLDAYQKAAGASLSVKCTSGQRDVYAIVNAPDMSAINSKSVLESTMVDLSANSKSGFVMYGKSTVTLPSSKSISIPVNRMVSRVVVSKISRAFESASLAKMDFTVKGIYLSDVAGNCNIAGAVNTIWYNTSGKKDELTSLLSDTVSSAIADGASYSTPHYFYAMPNNNKTKTTKVVIEAVLGSQTFYYPVLLPALESNHSYEIANITIKRPGADTPDTPVSSEDISFTINIVDWTSVAVDDPMI